MLPVRVLLIFVHLLAASSSPPVLSESEGSHAKLLFADRNSIHAAEPVANSTSTRLLSDLKFVVAMDYVRSSRQLFWSDYTKKKLFTCTLEENISAPSSSRYVTEVVGTRLSSPDGLAADWVHELLYWTDSVLATVSVVQFSGKHRRTLFDTGLVRPWAIAVDPLRGVMFWSDFGSQPKIERAGMDGTNREVIVSNDVDWPEGVALDLDRQRLFWTDGYSRKICSADYFGGDRVMVIGSGVTPQSRPFVPETLRHPASLAVCNGNVYWTDWDLHGVQVANTVSGKTNVLFPGHTGVKSVRVAHEATQPEISNDCSVEFCSQLCAPAFNLASGSSPHRQDHRPYTCLCADGYLLDGDGRGCIADNDEVGSRYFANCSYLRITFVVSVLFTLFTCITCVVVVWQLVRKLRIVQWNVRNVNDSDHGRNDDDCEKYRILPV